MKKLLSFVIVGLVFPAATTTAAAGQYATDRQYKIDERSMIAADDTGQPMLVNLAQNDKTTVMSVQYQGEGYCISKSSSVLIVLESGAEVVLQNINGSDCRVGAMYVVSISPEKVDKLKSSPVKSMSMLTDDGTIQMDAINDKTFFVRCFKK